MSARRRRSRAMSRRAEQYVARFRKSGVLSFVDGALRPAASGRTFETRTPIDDAVLASVAAGDAADVAAAADAAQRAFAALARRARRRAAQLVARDCGRDRGARGRDRAARVARHGPADPLHVGGREARRREFPFLRGQSARSRPRLVAAGARARELHAAPAARPRRGHHAVEHAVHAGDVEDRARARGGLHRRAQAGRVEPDHGHAARGDRGGSRTARRRAEHRARARRDRGQGGDRASEDSRRRFRRRVGHRQRRSWRRAPRR